MFKEEGVRNTSLKDSVPQMVSVAEKTEICSFTSAIQFMLLLFVFVTGIFSVPL